MLDTTALSREEVLLLINETPQKFRLAKVSWIITNRGKYRVIKDTSGMLWVYIDEKQLSFAWDLKNEKWA